MVLKRRQEFPGPKIRQNFILKQIDNPNRLSERQTGERNQPLRCGAGESRLGYHGEITSPMNT